jgi:hypothetical protein
MFTRSIVVGFVLASGLSEAAVEPHAPGHAAGSVPVTRPPQSSPQASPQRTQRLVFSCRDSGVVIFSDRPCGEASVQRSLEVITPASPGRPPTTEPAPARAVTKAAAREETSPRDERADRCQKLRHAVDAIDDRMRTGYSARQAPRLWQQWRDAKERLHDAHC